MASNNTDLPLTTVVTTTTGTTTTTNSNDKPFPNSNYPDNEKDSADTLIPILSTTTGGQVIKFFYYW